LPFNLHYSQKANKIVYSIDGQYVNHTVEKNSFCLLFASAFTSGHPQKYIIFLYHRVFVTCHGIGFAA